MDQPTRPECAGGIPTEHVCASPALGEELQYYGTLLALSQHPQLQLEDELPNLLETGLGR